MDITHLLGRRRGPWIRTWTADDALRYALAVGAGAADPTVELAFTTENTAGVAQRALPTFAIALAQEGGPQAGLTGVDLTKVLHAEQSLTLHKPLPVAGSVALTSTVTDGTDPADGTPMFSTRSAMFVRDAVGPGRARGPLRTFAPPADRPDAVLRQATAPNQALLYRLTGDRNPLHADPAFAAAAGFPRPILHGLATYGFVVRMLLNEFAAGNPDRLTTVDGRFTRPVFPGDELVVTAWKTADGAVFRAANGAGEVVLDRGRAGFTGPG